MSEQVDPEEDPYLLQHEIVKIKVTYNIAAGMNYTIEYLYDKKQDLIFYFQEENGHSSYNKNRLYFKSKKLIKTISATKSDENEEEKKTYTKNFKKSDIDAARIAISNSLKYKALFSNLLEIEQLN